MAATKLNGATKINANMASISWDKVNGASYYDIYNGSKKVKTVKGNKTYAVVKKKGAGKGKYKVVARISEKINGKSTTYTNKKKCKKTVTPHKNEKVYYKGAPSSGSWAKKCYFSVQSIKVSGSTYTVTGYAVNRRLFTCNKWRSLTIKIKSNGKVVVPDFRGKSLREAAGLAADKGLLFQSEGSGYAVGQSIELNTLVDKGTGITVYFEPG